ncbi:MAG TPA: tetratricopeptide repeat protein [Verrucomicrobiae bacterium]|nr:tetratricopeptide repeat protein [Verrucomicrobiae bacterium]
MSKNTEKSTRPSSADYPVDPAERSNQEARLRKAAAAGATASKSPIPGLMLQPSPDLTATQKASEPQTELSKGAPLIERASGTSNDATEARIINNEILVELRKISAWADLQRKITKWSLILLAVFVSGAIGMFILTDRRLQTNVESNLAPHQSDWYDVDRKVRQGNFEGAIAIGEDLVLKTPQYPEAHERLAKAYLAAGNLEKAKEHYAEAYRLFPSEENEKLLNAVERRTRSDKE